MSDPGALGAEKNQTDASSSLLPEGLPSFEEVTRSMQVIHQSPCRNQNLKRSCLHTKVEMRLMDTGPR